MRERKKCLHTHKDIYGRWVVNSLTRKICYFIKNLKLFIMEVASLIPIGAKIKVDKSKIENLLPNKLLDNLPQMINGEIVDYKMTDGMGIGYVLITENNLRIWIFNSELNEQTKREYKIEDINKSHIKNSDNLILGKYEAVYEINSNRKMKDIAKPINLINWLIFTLKDIF